MGDYEQQLGAAIHNNLDSERNERIMELEKKLQEVQAELGQMREAINTVIANGCTSGAFRRHCIPALGLPRAKAHAEKVEGMRTALQQISQARLEPHAAGEYYVRSQLDYTALIDKIQSIAVNALKEDNDEMPRV